MTNTNRTPAEQAVLDAARKLAKAQALDIHYERLATEATQRRNLAKITLEMAKGELIVADCQYATANLRLQQAKLRLHAHESTYSPALIAECHEAKEQLWAVATSTDEEQILRAALQYSQKMGLLGHYNDQRDELSVECYEAEDALKSATKLRASAVQKRDRAKADSDTAHAECRQAYDLSAKQVMVPQLELCLAGAAEDLTGVKPHTYSLQLTNRSTSGWYYSHSHVPTKDLPISIDEARLQELTAEALADSSWAEGTSQSNLPQAEAASEAPWKGSSLMSE